MITGVAIHDIEVVNLVEMVFGGIGGENSCHSRIEAAAQNSRQPFLLEALLIAHCHEYSKCASSLGS
mgnify:CR=1 FL=1